MKKIAAVLILCQIGLSLQGQITRKEKTTYLVAGSSFAVLSAGSFILANHFKYENPTYKFNASEYDIRKTEVERREKVITTAAIGSIFAICSAANFLGALQKCDDWGKRRLNAEAGIGHLRISYKF